MGSRRGKGKNPRSKIRWASATRKHHRAEMHGAIFPMPILLPKPYKAHQSRDWLFPRSTTGWFKMSPTLRIRETVIHLQAGRSVALFTFHLIGAPSKQPPRGLCLVFVYSRLSRCCQTLVVLVEGRGGGVSTCQKNSRCNWLSCKTYCNITMQRRSMSRCIYVLMMIT